MSYRHSQMVRRIVHHLVAILCPPDAAALGIADDLADHLERMMDGLPAPMRQGMVAGLITYDVGGLATQHRQRAHALTVAAGTAYYESWLHGATPVQRQLAKALGQLLTLAYYEHPLVQTAIGYTPAAWIDHVKARRLKMYQPAIDAHAAALLAPEPLRPGVRLRSDIAPKRDKRNELPWR